MFQRIIVPLDGSDRAEQAVPVAARLARAGGGSVVLLKVLTPLMDLSWPVQGLPTPMEDQAAEHQVTTDYLLQIAASEALQGVETTIKVIDGLATTAILDAVRDQQADIIVLSSHGRTGMKRWAMGSVAQHVARYSPVPVLVLHKESRGLRHAPHPVRVMVALDGSALAESALMPAVQLSTALSAPFPGALHLIRILPFTPIFNTGQDNDRIRVREQEILDAQTYLHEIQQRLFAKNLDLYITTSFAINPDVANALMNIAEMGEEEGLNATTTPSDILALATHGRSGPIRWMTGSVTERVLGATTLPLLIVHPLQAGTPDILQKASTTVS